MRNEACNLIRWMIDQLKALLEKIDTGVPIHFIDNDDSDGPMEVTDDKVWIVVLHRRKMMTTNVMVGSYPAIARELIKLGIKAHSMSIHSLKQYREIAIKKMSEVG